MKIEKDLSFLMSLVAIGAVIVSALAMFIHSTSLLIIAVPCLIIAILMALMNKKSIVKISENLETIVFFFTLIVIIISFIYLYKPA